MRARKRPTDILPRIPENAVYSTALGIMIKGKSEEVLSGSHLNGLKKRVQLIFTSPPFPLNTKKRYGNLKGEEYLDWLASFGPLFVDMLTDDGSIVIELGNSWEQGLPAMSTLGLRALLKFQEDNNLHLCQEIICHNPARLPSPAQWVNIERIRLKDSFTRLWWLSPSSRPKANNRNVLQAYSEAMRKLLRTKKYNSGGRPSQHNIGKSSFTRDHGGSIPSSVLSFANTGSVDPYLDYCRSHRLEFHPARMPAGVPDFFIRFLTEPGDLVLDPFGGSNTTGASAEMLGRRWITIEPKVEYVCGSLGRFDLGTVHVF